MMGLISVIGWGLFCWLPDSTGRLFPLICYDAIRNFQIPYFAYVFAKVSKDHFTSVSSFTHAAVFTGNLIGGAFFELFLRRWISDEIIFYSIFATQIIATVIAVCLPKLDRMQTPVNLRNHGIWIFEQLKFAYTNYRISIWSLWFIVGTTLTNQFSEICANLEKTSVGYSQWYTNLRSPVSYLGEFSGIVLILLACFVFMRTKRHALLVLIVVSLASGGLMFLAAIASNSSILHILLAFVNIIYMVTVTMSR